MFCGPSLATDMEYDKCFSNNPRGQSEPNTMRQFACIRNRKLFFFLLSHWFRFIGEIKRVVYLTLNSNAVYVYTIYKQTVMKIDVNKVQQTEINKFFLKERRKNTIRKNGSFPVI